MNRHLPQRAFTIIEFLVAVGIVAILAALAFPSLQRAMTSSQRIACASNMRQVGAAIQLFAGDHGGVLPYNFAGSIGPQKINDIYADSDIWRVAWFLAPYIDDKVWDCVDPLNRKNRLLPGSRGMVWTKSSEVLSSDWQAPKGKRLLEYPQPGSVSLFYCAYSPANGPGTPGHRPWPHRGIINQLFLDGHVDGSLKPTWPD